MTPLTAEQRRELVERPFPIVRHALSYRHTGPCVTRWSNHCAPVEGHSRSYNGTAFHINGLLYGEEYRRWS